MNGYQVTALFGNVWEVVGHDCFYQQGAADALARKYRGLGYSVRVHHITGKDSSRVLYELS
jgi:hypothetical protein